MAKKDRAAYLFFVMCKNVRILFWKGLYHYYILAVYLDIAAKAA